MNNEAQPYRVLIIEPSQIVQAGLSTLIGQCKNFTVVSVLPDLSFLKPSPNDAIDIILVDPSVINYDHRTDMRATLAIQGRTLVFAISYTPYEEQIMYQYDGCIFLHDSKEAILKKFNTALEQAKHSPRTENNELSQRERSILTAVAQGKTNKEIADEFNLSIYTVVTHRKNISNKLGINTISGLTVYAILNKLIDVTDF